jgi:hypothetical protein
MGKRKVFLGEGCYAAAAASFYRQTDGCFSEDFAKRHRQETEERKTTYMLYFLYLELDNTIKCPFFLLFYILYKQ